MSLMEMALLQRRTAGAFQHLQYLLQQQLTESIVRMTTFQSSNVVSARCPFSLIGVKRLSGWWSHLIRAGSVTETEKSVFRKTETETDVGVEKTEKNR